MEIFKEEFIDNHNNWWTGEDNNILFKIENGRGRFENKSTNECAWNLVSLKLPPMTAYDIKLTLDYVTFPKNSLETSFTYYGPVWSYEEDVYYLLLYGLKHVLNQYSFWRIRDGKWESIHDWIGLFSGALASNSHWLGISIAPYPSTRCFHLNGETSFGYIPDDLSDKSIQLLGFLAGPNTKLFINSLSIEDWTKRHQMLIDSNKQKAEHKIRKTYNQYQEDEYLKEILAESEMDGIDTYWELADPLDEGWNIFED